MEHVPRLRRNYFFFRQSPRLLKICPRRRSSPLLASVNQNNRPFVASHDTALKRSNYWFSSVCKASTRKERIWEAIAKIVLHFLQTTYLNGRHFFNFLFFSVFPQLILPYSHQYSALFSCTHVWLKRSTILCLESLLFLKKLLQKYCLNKLLARRTLQEL